MTPDEPSLRTELGAMFMDYLPDDSLRESLADHLADCVLTYEPIASALALQREIGKLKLGHSTGDVS